MSIILFIYQCGYMGSLTPAHLEYTFLPSLICINGALTTPASYKSLYC